MSAEESKSLFALNFSTGSLIWQYTGAEEELNGSPSVARDTVYVGSNDHNLHAVDRITGEAKFIFGTCANVFSSAAIADNGMIFIACNTVTGGEPWVGVGAVYSIDPSLHETQEH